MTVYLHIDSNICYLSFKGGCHSNSVPITLTLGSSSRLLLHLYASIAAASARLILHFKPGTASTLPMKVSRRLCQGLIDIPINASFIRSFNIGLHGTGAKEGNNLHKKGSDKFVYCNDISLSESYYSTLNVPTGIAVAVIMLM